MRNHPQSWPAGLRTTCLVMFLATLFGIAGGTISACSWWQKTGAPIAQGAWDCAKEEGTALKGQVSVAQVTIDVVTALVETIADGGDPTRALSELATKYKPILGPDAEGLVACIARDLRDAPAPAAQTPAAAGLTPEAAAALSLPSELKLAAARAIDGAGWKYKATPSGR